MRVNWALGGIDIAFGVGLVVAIGVLCYGAALCHEVRGGAL